MTASSRSDLWRELVEIRNVIREIAIRHNIEAHEDDDVHVILNEMQLDDFVFQFSSFNFQ